MTGTVGSMNFVLMMKGLLADMYNYNNIFEFGPVGSTFVNINGGRLIGSNHECLSIRMMKKTPMAMIRKSLNLLKHELSLFLLAYI